MIILRDISCCGRWSRRKRPMHAERRRRRLRSSSLRIDRRAQLLSLVDLQCLIDDATQYRRGHPPRWCSSAGVPRQRACVAGPTCPPVHLLKESVSRSHAFGAACSTALIRKDRHLGRRGPSRRSSLPPTPRSPALIMLDERVPGRVRRVLNVESGLRRRHATPFVGLFIAGATVAAEVARARGRAAVALLISTGVGLGVRLAGAALCARRNDGTGSRPRFARSACSLSPSFPADDDRGQP